jgi:integrase/recombinase XerD
VAPARTVDPGNSALLREYLAYLRVEKGLRPLSCEAYERDLLQFAEYLDRQNLALLDATQALIGGFLEHLAKHDVESRSTASTGGC